MSLNFSLFRFQTWRAIRPFIQTARIVPLISLYNSFSKGRIFVCEPAFFIAQYWVFEIGNKVDWRLLKMWNWRNVEAGRCTLQLGSSNFSLRYVTSLQSSFLPITLSIRSYLLKCVVIPCLQIKELDSYIIPCSNFVNFAHWKTKTVLWLWIWNLNWDFNLNEWNSAAIKHLNEFLGTMVSRVCTTKKDWGRLYSPFFSLILTEHLTTPELHRVTTALNATVDRKSHQLSFGKTWTSRGHQPSG